jgi:hypothetical protein
MSLSDRVSENPALLEDLQDSSLGHTEVARRHGCSETSVRRWRSANDISVNKPETLRSPYPSNERPLPVLQHDGTAKTWTPGVVIRNGEADVCTAFVAVDGQSPDHKKLLEDAGLNPAEWKITRISPLVRKDEGMTAYWFRAVPVVGGPVPTVEDMDAIIAQYAHQPQVNAMSTGRILMVPSGDLQLGKPEGGGTEATIERFTRYTDDIRDELWSNDTRLSLLVLPWLGDCIEGIVSQHGRNIASLDMPITEQVRVYRRLMMHQIITLAPFADNVLIPVVPGNHDETTREQQMPHTDSWAIEGASAAADFFRDRPGFEHLAWAFPDPGGSTVTVKIADELTVGFMHGHTSGRSRPEQIIDWWTKQDFGRAAIGEADILVSAHWHHLRVQSAGGNRTWFQIPAMDGGSGWFKEKTGDDAQTGQLAIELTPGKGAGWSRYSIYA